MTKKDFVLIAGSLYRACPVLTCPWQDPSAWPIHKLEDFANGALESWKDSVRLMATELAATNPRFNRDTFIKACCPEGLEI